MVLLTRVGASLALLLTCACLPDVAVDESLVQAPRILAVTAEPAEAAPKSVVRFRALVGGPRGTLSSSPLNWSYCTARKPLAELGPVSRACLDADTANQVRVGDGLEVTSKVPDDACSLFGPNPPPPRQGEPAGRPVDPDPTGGFYQPLRVQFGSPDESDLSFGFLRLSCGLAGLTQPQAAEFTRRYRANSSPRIETVSRVTPEGLVRVGEGERLEVQAGETLEVRVEWPSCPSIDTCGDGVCGLDETAATCDTDCRTPRGCAGSERYLAFDVAQRVFRTQREGIRLSWYTTEGLFAEQRQGYSAEAEPQEALTNSWTAPELPGDVTWWMVIRDDRGGTGFREVPVRVLPRTS